MRPVAMNARHGWRESLQYKAQDCDIKRNYCPMRIPMITVTATYTRILRLHVAQQLLQIKDRRKQLCVMRQVVGMSLMMIII